MYLIETMDNEADKFYEDIINEENEARHDLFVIFMGNTNSERKKVNNFYMEILEKTKCAKLTNEYYLNKDKFINKTIYNILSLYLKSQMKKKLILFKLLPFELINIVNEYDTPILITNKTINDAHNIIYTLYNHKVFDKNSYFVDFSHYTYMIQKYTDYFDS